MSEVAQFRAQQAAEEEAARAGLYGSAVTARHDFIVARMEQGAQDLLQLIAAGRGDEAMQLWEGGYFDE
jgi:hypothetical protein